MTNSDLDAYLASPEKSTRCRTCQEHPELLDVIVEFLGRKENGEHHLPTQGKKSLHSFLQTKGFKLKPRCLIYHITSCLKLDHRTGRTL